MANLMARSLRSFNYDLCFLLSACFGFLTAREIPRVFTECGRDGVIDGSGVNLGEANLRKEAN